MNLPIGNRRLYAPYHEGHADPRRALGTPRQASWPQCMCAYCFRLNGALIQATHYHDDTPCCPACAGNGNRRVM